MHVVGFGLRTYVLFGRPLNRPKVIYDFDEWMSKHLSHRLGFRTYYRILEWVTRRQAHGIVVASRALEKVIRRMRPDMGAGLLYLPIGVDFKELDKNRQLDEALSVRLGRRPKFTYIGTISRNYQVWELIDLAEFCRREGRNYLFVVVGGGKHLSEFRKEIVDRSLETYFSIEGRKPRNHLGSYLRTTDVLIFPFPPTEQNLYRCPSKIFQYIASNKPIVTNRVSEVAEALGDQGLYYEPGDIKGMLRACDLAINTTLTTKPNPNVQTFTWSARCEDYRKWLERFWKEKRLG